MNRILVAAALALAVAGPVRAQVIIDQQPANAPDIEAQPLPPPAAPTPLAPGAGSVPPALPVSPHEGPEERALDQSLGLAPQSLSAPASPGVTPSAQEDAAIEARINAMATGQTSPHANGKIPEMPPTTIITGSGARPSTTAPAAPVSNRWEGPEERALDQADPLTGQLAPQGLPTTSDPQAEETRRLNGGN